MKKCPEQESNGIELVASLLIVILIVIALLGYASVHQNEKEDITNVAKSVYNTGADIKVATVPAEFCNTSYDGGVGVFTCRFNIDIEDVNNTLYYMEITRDWDKVMRLQGADKVLEGKDFEVEFDLTDLSVRTARPLDYDSIYDVY